MIFIKNSICYDIKKDLSEFDDIFYERAYFIIQLEPKSDKELKEYEKYSRIMINIKYNKCEYSQEIMKKLHEIKSNKFNL